MQTERSLGTATIDKCAALVKHGGKIAGQKPNLPANPPDGGHSTNAQDTQDY